MGRTVAVIDVGKTNKKIELYDNTLQRIDSRRVSFASVYRNGIIEEPIEAIREWVLNSLAELCCQHDIAAIIASTHGSAVACVDARGDLCVPVLDYTFEPGPDFHEQFFQLVGDRDELQRSTATMNAPALGNAAKTIFYLQQNLRQEFERTSHVLMYPQFITHMLCGIATAEPTYLGCHSYLFDHRCSTYSVIVDRLGVRHLFPPKLSKPGDIAGKVRPDIARRTGLSKNTLVLVGIHDSNASLLPYLLKWPDRDFILNSTGSWCVVMRPQQEIWFADDDIGKAVYYNMSAFGQPVKTTNLAAGIEAEAYCDLIDRCTGTAGYLDYDPAVYRDVVSNGEEFVLPAVLPGTGQYPGSKARLVDHGTACPFVEASSDCKHIPLLADGARAYAALNLSLALQTALALRRVGIREGDDVYIEGGFRNNDAYARILAALFPNCRVSLTNLEEATSFGAALLGWAAADDIPAAEVALRYSMEKEIIMPASLPGLDRYGTSFDELAGVTNDR